MIGQHACVILAQCGSQQESVIQGLRSLKKRRSYVAPIRAGITLFSKAPSAEVFLGPHPKPPAVFRGANVFKGLHIGDIIIAVIVMLRHTVRHVVSGVVQLGRNLG